MPFFIGVLFLIFFASTSSAQNETANWIMPLYADNEELYHVKFSFNGNTLEEEINIRNDDSPIFYEPNLTSSSMSDREGNLLFYTISRTYTRDHRLMPGLQETDSLSRIYQSLTIPVPGTQNLFYIFSLYRRSVLRNTKLDYSVVDMRKNGGYGEVIENTNIFSGYPTPGFTIVKHSDGEHFWFFYYDKAEALFKSRKITGSGIDENAITSSFTFEFPDWWEGRGELNYKVSPDQKKLAILVSAEYSWAQFIYLFDFNSETGEVSNGRMLENILNSGEVIYDAEFSPDSKLLYYSLGAGIYQVNISHTDTSDIQRTQVKPCPSSYFTRLQLAQNGKIYFFEGLVNSSMGVIHDPNREGILCHVEFEEKSWLFFFFYLSRIYIVLSPTGFFLPEYLPWRGNHFYLDRYYSGQCRLGFR
ncbi:hypothetical protein RCC89_06550 [Cytophagaceae bacterium ABcell3]|nr:hypothetical protein RCC89_06550 [Cytophagaceae bacterium ABcell3]